MDGWTLTDTRFIRSTLTLLNRQKKSTQFLLHTTSPMSLPDRVKIWHMSVTPSSPNSDRKWPTACWFERRRHSMANCSIMVTIKSL